MCAGAEKAEIELSAFSFICIGAFQQFGDELPSNSTSPRFRMVPRFDLALYVKFAKNRKKSIFFEVRRSSWGQFCIERSRIQVY